MRLRRGLSLGALAARAGVAKSSLSTWESGERAPRLPELRRVLDFLNATPEDRLAVYQALGRVAAWEPLGLPRDDGGFFLADAIYGLRTRAGISQGEIARRVGVSHAAVGKWERGESEPSESARERLSFALGLAPDEARLLGSILAQGEPIWLDLAHRTTLPDLDELAARFAADERLQVLQKLGAYHASRRRALVDPHWDAVHTFAAEKASGALMIAHRDEEWVRFNERAIATLPRDLGDRSRQSFSVETVLARLRNTPEDLDASDAERLFERAHRFGFSERLWAYAVAARVAASAQSPDLVKRIVETTVPDLEMPGSMGVALYASAQSLADVGEGRSALVLLGRFYDRFWEEAEANHPAGMPRDPQFVLIDVARAEAYRQLGSPAEAGAALDMAARRLEEAWDQRLSSVGKAMADKIAAARRELETAP